MKVLTRRVVPKKAKAVRRDVEVLKKRARSTNLLDLGDTGRAVEALQRHLKAAGIFQGKATGTFDLETQTALLAFQQAKKLPLSGALDLGTLKALKAVNLFVKKGFEKSPAKLGQVGGDIRNAERKLARLGFLNEEKADGVFDAATSRAVKRYARADKQVDNDRKTINARFWKELSKATKSWAHAPWRRREVTGEKGLKRHKALDEKVFRAVENRPEGLGRGAEGQAVKWLQTHLEKAGFEQGAVNGKFGSRTEAALKAFQEKAKLEPTGRLDKRTWTKLKGAYFGAKSSASPAQRAGERSGAVKRSEKMLKALGYNVGKVDGLFSARTEAAVERFQKKHDLKVTGTVGSRTLKKLKKLQWNPGTWKPGPGRLQGGDFSDWQSDSLFKSVVNRSKFAIIKATEDNDFVADSFKRRWRYLGKRQKQGKLPLRMAYSFLHAGNGVGQAKHLLRTVGIKGKLPPGTRLVLDWEASALSSPQTLRDAARYLHKKTGVWPVVYASASQISRVRQAVPKAFIWMAKWDSSIPRNVPFVQYTDSPYDKNVFNGNLKALRRFAGYRS